MTKTLKRRGYPLLTLILLLALVGLFAGLACSGDETTDATDATGASLTTGTTGSSSSTVTTAASGEKPDTSTAETVVVGGGTKEEYEAALPELEAAVAAAPEDLEALDALVIAQFGLGMYEEAAVTYEKILAIKEDPFMRNNYGNVLRKLGRIEEAKAMYEQAMAADPTLVYPYINLAHTLLDEGDYEGAMELLKTGLDKVTGDDKTSIQSLIDRLTEATSTT